MQEIIFTNEVEKSLQTVLHKLDPDKIFYLTDTNTEPIGQSLASGNDEVIVIKAGDVNKNIESLTSLWETLSLKGATRRSVMVNVGGGMVTDLGGFAAACFKRGIRFINIPTTLLGAVDAAVGGKTGINFLHFKNEIGAFKEADAVIISTRFFATLPKTELHSGFAEMLKHGLISSREHYVELLDFDIDNASLVDLLLLLEQNVEVKRHIVAEDPTEKGLRKALNLGHTAGHAIESLAMERNSPMPHGYAVAHGLLIEMIISHLLRKFPSAELHQYTDKLRELYAPMPQIECRHYDRLLELMAHDKKNQRAGEINFTLLNTPGEPVINQIVEADTIRTALDIYRDITGQ